MLYIMVCIPLRLTLAALVGWLGTTQDDVYMYVFMGLETLAIFSYVWNCKCCKPAEVWWPRFVHVGTAAMAIVLAVMVVKEVMPGWSLSILLGVDVLLGVAVAVSKRPYSGAQGSRYQEVRLGDIAIE